MSGVEVAGLVLGVLPLVIAGLEAYNESLDPLRAFYRWERELPHFIHKLRQQHVHFEQTLRILFSPITTESQLARMIVDPIGAWNDEQLASDLKRKLDDAYEAYEATIADIETIMIKISSKLDLERAQQITRNDLEAMLLANPQQAKNKFEFRKRVKFGMSKKKIQALLSELNDCNRQLERFTEKSEKLESYKKPCKPSYARKLQKMQSYAKQLHSVLIDAWSCSCHSSHTTNLQLEQRLIGSTTGTRSTNDDSSGALQFSIAFSSTCPPWSWQKAHIRVSEPEPDDLKMSKLSLSKQSTISKREVDFAPLPQKTLPQPPSRASTLVTLVGDEREITDICSVIHQYHLVSRNIEFSLSSGGKLQGARPIPSCETESMHDMVSLDQLLNPQPSPNVTPTKLTRKERYKLAVNLASSTLQLYATPWIDNEWSKKDILFRLTKVGPRAVDTEHPYVAMISGAGSVSSPMTPKNTILLALAVTLLELYFGSSREQQKQLPQLHDYLNHPSPWALLAMTYEWANQEQENLSAAFNAAIKCCLQSFSDPSGNLLDTMFLQAAVEGIVLPLQEELSQFLGITAS